MVARDVLVVTWGPGGNLPPMLAVASLLARRGHRVRVLASAATEPAVVAAGLTRIRYERTADPDIGRAFEDQAEAALALAAGSDLADDVGAVIAWERPNLSVVDCMLPAAIAAARAARTLGGVGGALPIRARQVGDAAQRNGMDDGSWRPQRDARGSAGRLCATAWRHGSRPNS